MRRSGFGATRALTQADVDDLLPQEVMSEVGAAFRTFFEPVDGEAAMAEGPMAELMDSLGVELSADEIRDLVREADEDGSHTMNLGEFQLLIARLMHDATTEAELVDAYRVLDPLGTGQLPLATLRQAVAADSVVSEEGGGGSDGEAVTAEEVEALLRAEGLVEPPVAGSSGETVDYLRFVRRMMTRG